MLLFISHTLDVTFPSSKLSRPGGGGGEFWTLNIPLFYFKKVLNMYLFRDGVDTDNIDESDVDEEVVEFLVKEESTVIQD